MFFGLQLDPAGKIKCDKAGDVGNGEAITGKVGHLGQALVEQIKKMPGEDVAAFDQARQLRCWRRGTCRRAIDKMRRGIAKGHGDAAKPLVLANPLPFFDPRLFKCAKAEQIGLWMKGFNITADGNGFGDRRAVIQHQNRRGASRVQGEKLWLQIVSRQYVERDLRQADALLGQKEADPARIGRFFHHVKLHSCCPFLNKKMLASRRTSPNRDCLWSIQSQHDPQDEPTTLVSSAAPYRRWWLPVALSLPFFGNAPPMKIAATQPAHRPAIEALLDDAFGTDRQSRTAYALRGGTIPALGLVVEDGPVLCGSITLTPVLLHGPAARVHECLLLGPIAIAPGCRGRGLGGLLINQALERARAQGHDLVMLIGDPAYYGRFGFSNAATGGWSLPGPVEQPRLMALSLRGAAVPVDVSVQALTSAAVPDYSLAV
jgi:predicted N-acetyltransferase YhbS